VTSIDISGCTQSVPDQEIECATTEGEHNFLGHHLVASYSGCIPEFLLDSSRLLDALSEAVSASGSTVLNRCEHVFPNGAITAVMLLSESHASIHTYPEYNACFVDLFTCGDSCDLLKFDMIFRQYLKPKIASTKILLRTHNIQDISDHSFTIN